MTLLTPRVPVAEVYLREARAIGARPEPEGFHAHLAHCWRTEGGRLRQDPQGEHRSSDEIERAMWHRFTWAVAAPFPELLARHEAWLGRLVRHFDSGAAWLVVDGAVDLIGSLRARGSRVGVVSNWHRALHGILEAVGLRAHLDFVVVSADIGRRKPHPEIFLQALRCAGAEARDAVHVGDSVQDDVEGARRAGIRPVLICRDEPEETLPEGASRVAHFQELARLLLDGRA
jgi:putative hydrolase of the HAD superfamily